MVEVLPRTNPWRKYAIYLLNFSQSVQLDPLSYELNNYLEDEIEAMLMSQIQSRKQIWFAYADIFRARKEFTYAFNAWLAEMMWGVDKGNREGYLPLSYNFNDGGKSLVERDPKWKWEFTKSTYSESGRQSWQQGPNSIEKFLSEFQLEKL